MKFAVALPPLHIPCSSTNAPSTPEPANFSALWQSASSGFLSEKRWTGETALSILFLHLGIIFLGIQLKLNPRSEDGTDVMGEDQHAVHALSSHGEESKYKKTKDKVNSKST